MKLPVESDDVPAELLQKRVKERLKYVNTLPTLPEIVLRLTKLISDPETTADDLEELLSSDAAIVHKILQVVNSSSFSGTRGEGRWTLKEAIVRLGLKQVGAIAQQIKLINALVRPEDSQFDLRRFWEHSVGCAYIADMLCTRKLIPLSKPIEFDQYWISALLHDIGKLVPGFFVWDYFEEITNRMVSHHTSFQRAENRLEHEVTHEYLGQLLLLNSDVGTDFVTVAATHNSTGRHPSELVCLVHLADNLCKDLGLGYLAEEKGVYDASVLTTLGVTKDDIDGMGESLGDGVVGEIQELVSRCIEG